MFTYSSIRSYISGLIFLLEMELGLPLWLNLLFGARLLQLVPIFVGFIVVERRIRRAEVWVGVKRVFGYATS